MNWPKYIQTRRISKNGQIAIPKHIRDKYNIQPNQMVRIVARGGRVIITPIKNENI